MKYVKSDKVGAVTISDLIGKGHYQSRCHDCGTYIVVKGKHNATYGINYCEKCEDKLKRKKK